MSKRKSSSISRAEPFGFDIANQTLGLQSPVDFGKVSHSIFNTILRFGANGQPIFNKPKKCWDIVSSEGLYVKLRDEKVFKGAMHTSHSVSIYNMAHNVRNRLRKQPRVHLGKETSSEFKRVDLRNAQENKRRSATNIVWTNAVHMGKTTVLKTTTDDATQLVYIIEAIIHSLAYDKCPNYIPALYFVGFAANNRLVIASEQLRIPSVLTFLNTIQNRADRHVWHMVRSVCLAIRRMQRTGGFTHRDCHISNVYYNGRRKIVKFIDYDWSCIRFNNKKISVPRHLYDTTRSEYTHNRSVDCCVFFRTLGPALSRAPTFKNVVWDPIMARYEQESKTLLFRKSKTDVGALQLYKMSTSNGKVRGKYAHKYGIKKLKVDFEYLMGHFTYPCMTPESILKFLDEHPL